MTFSAILIEKQDSGQSARFAQLDNDQLISGDVTIDVEYSTLNFKDALAIAGQAPIIRSFPMIPGIDLAGTICTSEHPDWCQGDKVILNGWGVGESHWGGLSQKARLKGDWLVPLPHALSSRQAMAIGTAGYTASLGVETLLWHGIEPSNGQILVTGATGGVGSIAIALLVKAGYSVCAATGKPSEGDYLRQLGATTIIDRNDLEAPGKPLQKQCWAAVLDSAGSHILANACAQTQEGGVVVACGNAQGMDFPASVAPFILRGITLVGIESVRAPKFKRLAAWERLARDLDTTALEAIATEIGLTSTIASAQRLLDGAVRGRLVVDVNQ